MATKATKPAKAKKKRAPLRRANNWKSEIPGIAGKLLLITVAVIVLTGVFGNLMASPLCRLFRLTDPVARGVAIGTSSHAIGTARAMEMDDVTGAVSGLSIAVSGVLTVAAAAILGNLV